MMEEDDDDLLAELEAQLTSSASDKEAVVPQASLSNSNSSASRRKDGDSHISDPSIQADVLPEESAGTLKNKLSQALAESALHLQTKNELSRELQSALSDLADQRKTFRTSLDESDRNCADLALQLRDARALIERLRSNPSDDGLSQDAQAKSNQKTVDIQEEIERLSSALRESNSEISIAQSKQARLQEENASMTRDNDALRMQLKNSVAAIEAADTRIRQLKTNLKEATATIRKFEEDAPKDKQLIDKLKQEAEQRDHILLWTQNKLQSESSKLVEVTEQFNKTSVKLHETQEERQQIKSEYAQVVQQLRTAGDSSIHVISQLQGDISELNARLEEELRGHAKTLEKLKATDVQLEQSQNTSKQLQQEVSKVKNENSRLQALLLRLSEADEQLKDCRDEIMTINIAKQALEDEKAILQNACTRYTLTIDASAAQNSSLQAQIATLTRDKDANLLAISQKSAAITLLEERVESLLQQVSRLQMQLDQEQNSKSSFESQLNELRLSSQSEITYLMAQLSKDTEEKQALQALIHDKDEEMKIHQRKTAQSLKDMSKQLQLAQKRAAQDQVEDSKQSPVITRKASNPAVQAPAPNREAPNLPDVASFRMELFKQDQKLAFYESHAAELTADIQNKDRIIQHFFLREQAGQLGPPLDAQRYGSTLSRIGPSMTSDISLELCKEINKKLQEVLEDYALQNIQLKTCIETLGNEIARLNQASS